MIKDKVSLLIKLSSKDNFNISVAESCTGGLLSSSIIEQSGASTIFNSGFVTYSNTAKVKLLNIDKKLITTYGAVSKETSVAMAKGLYKKTKSNIIVSITGVAGPNGGTMSNPVGTVYFTFGIKETNKNIIYITNKMNFNLKNRLKIQKKSVSYALSQFIEIIKSYKFD